MKIFEIIPNLSSGGAEKFVLNLCNELSETKNEIWLLVLYPLTGPYAFYLSQLSSAIKIISLNKKAGFDKSIFLKVYNLIQKEKPDIVHTHLNAITYISLTLFLYKQTKYFHTIHYNIKSIKEKKLIRLLEKILFRKNIIHPIAVSREIQKNFYDIHKTNPYLINNGSKKKKCDSTHIESYINSYRKTNKTLILLFAGRLSVQKNPMLLCRSVSELVTQGYDLQLLLIGRVEDKTIQQNIEELNCRNIHFLGEKQDITTYMRYVDAVCLSSKSEGMPMVIIESISVGTIPLSTPAGGVKDMITNKKDGLLSYDMTLAGYKNMLLQFITMPIEEKELMKKECLNNFSNYTIGICAGKYLSFFESKILKNK